MPIQINASKDERVIDGDFELGKFSEYGKGEENEPYVIENLDKEIELHIKNTNAFFIIRNSSIQKGLYLENVSNAIIENISSYGNEVGIKIENSSKIIIRDSNFYDCNYGIFIMFSSNITILRNNLWNNSMAGIYITGEIYVGAWAPMYNYSITYNKAWENLYGIIVRGAVNATIAYNEVFENTDNGIYIFATSKSKIIENIANNNTYYGIHLDSTADWNFVYRNTANYNGYSGFWLDAVSNNTLVENEANYNVYDGFSLIPLTETGYWVNFDNIIENNEARFNGRCGIKIVNSPYTILRKNILSNNLWNLDIYGENLEHYYNEIEASNTADGKPIYYIKEKKDLVFENADIGYFFAVSCQNITIKNVSISNSGQGILFVNVSNSTITNSSFTNNSYGTFLLKSFGNKIYRNNFINNYVNAYDDGNNSYDDGENGNYWHDYNGSDKNNDGIGEEIYRIGENKDRFPFMHQIKPVQQIIEDNATHGWYTYKPVVINLIAPNEISKIKKTYYKIWLNGSPEPREYSEGKYIIIEEDGNWLIKYYSIDNAGNEGKEKIREVKIDTKPPARIDKLFAKEIRRNSIKIFWNENTDDDFAYYEIYIATDKNFSNERLVGKTTYRNNTLWFIGGLSQNKNYYFRVKVFDLAGLNSSSTKVCFKTLSEKEEDENITFLFIIIITMILICSIIFITEVLRK
ncbi:MAG: NosD domain-containing protein [Candidatus Thermoplasmatota archaeon]